MTAVMSRMAIVVDGGACRLFAAVASARRRLPATAWAIHPLILAWKNHVPSIESHPCHVPAYILCHVHRGNSVGRVGARRTVDGTECGEGSAEKGRRAQEI